MGAIQRITDRLRCRADLRYEISGNTITVESSHSGGFAVSLTEAPREWVVSFDGWHEHFSSEDEALNCFTFGLSDQSRLKVEYRGAFPRHWTLEARTEDGWQPVSTTGRLFFPFWRRPRVEYRQNRVRGQKASK